ncbi:hypothetical protein HYQ46_005488 [Verticillium longisporum]|nr:hypothetical protein HYQ46_005488 [Verticillium longisporum]
MADNLAYLAHSEENVHMVSAVTLEEHPSCLDYRLHILQVAYDHVSELIDFLETLSRKLEQDDISRALEHIIMKCASIAAAGNMRSLEEHLKFNGVSSVLYSSPEVRQIDKLARYLLLCKDFLRLARKPEYRALFSHINVIALEAFSGIIRPGLSLKCFFHAEIQQILHLERNICRPDVRAIGCSKSACYLCDLFILKQGRDCISHAHRRLYERWTIPDVDWMTEAQACAFSAIIQDMIQHMDEAVRFQQARDMPRRLDPVESKASYLYQASPRRPDAVDYDLFPLDAARSLAVQPVIAVARVHRLGIVHGDIDLTNRLL